MHSGTDRECALSQTAATTANNSTKKQIDHVYDYQIVAFPFYAHFLELRQFIKGGFMQTFSCHICVFGLGDCS